MRWRAWLDRVAPGGTDRIARAIVGLPPRPTYGGVPDSADEALLLASEWSVREGRTARVAFTVDGSRLAPRELSGRLRLLGARDERVLAFAEAVRSELDIAIGVDWPGRPKLYLHRPHNVAPERFLEVLREGLPLGDLEPSFVAWDLGHRTRWKAYFAGSERPVGAPAVEVRGDVVAPWVVSRRFEGNKCIDKTVHARVVDVPDIPGYRDLQEGEKIETTYVSWTRPAAGTSAPVVTVYYRVIP